MKTILFSIKMFIYVILNICGVFGLVISGIAGFICFIGALGIFLVFTIHKFYPAISLVAGHPSYTEAMIMAARFSGGGVVCFLGWHFFGWFASITYQRNNSWQIIK